MRLRLFLPLLLLFAVPCFSGASEQQEPTTYVVKQGDTLWGLSERFIKDPKYWPSMWQKNSQITNPHLIYPGQKLQIFSDHIGEAPKEQASQGAGMPKAAVAGKAAEMMQEVTAEKSYQVYGSEGFLMEKAVVPAGTIIGVHNDRILAGDEDIVYTDIGKNRGGKSGDKFSIYRKDIAVSHPITSEVMGIKVIPVGTLQITDVDKNSSRAIITKATKEVGPGAFLMPYKGGGKREIALKMPTRELKGFIIESYSGINIIAAGDVVYIDLGTLQGAQVGNMLYIVRDVAPDQRYAEGRVDSLPQELLGALVIIETGRKVATALVVKSIDAIYKGDRIVSLTK